jgi:hypothetical protein
MSLHAALAILGPIAAYISSILSSARVLALWGAPTHLARPLIALPFKRIKSVDGIRVMHRLAHPLDVIETSFRGDRIHAIRGVADAGARIAVERNRTSRCAWRDARRRLRKP